MHPHSTNLCFSTGFVRCEWAWGNPRHARYQGTAKSGSSFKPDHVKRVTVVIKCLFFYLLQGAAGKSGSPGEVGLQGLLVSLNVEIKKCSHYMNFHNVCEGQKHLAGNNKVQIQHANVQWLEVSKFFFLLKYFTLLLFYCIFWSNKCRLC